MTTLRMAACGLASLILMASTTLAQTSPHGKLSIDCGECHSAASWKVMAYPLRFDHETTGFALVGQHALVKCVSCHSSLEFAREGGQCLDCHTDVHRAELGTLCERCHTSRSWVIPDMVQKHAQTRFALVGAHATVSCDRCHTNFSKYEYVGLQSDCYACHAATYETTTTPNHRSVGFSTDCIQCHSVTALRWEGTFDHGRTGFLLTGAHAAIACTQCHPSGTFSMAPSQCVGCHLTDFNSTTNPPHASGFSTECQTCHTTSAWQPATFNHDIVFQLTGAHRALPCVDCHAGNNYANTPRDCAGCHTDDYNATTSPVHAPGFSTVCQTCHSTTAWQPSTFNHDAVFQLTGAHLAVPCVDCHVGGNYTNTPRDCAGCHLNDYDTATNPVHAPGFSTVCQTCHSTTAWQPSTFNHATVFQLTGAHQSVPCVDCHVGGNYTNTPRDCAGCHTDDYNAATNPVHAPSFSTLCQTCHSTTAWRPATYDHESEFPIASGTSHPPGRWNSCSDCHIVANDYTAFSCITCHPHSDKAKVDGDHRGENGYTYTPTSCYRCHPRGRP